MLWIKSKTPASLCVIHHRQNPIESINISLFTTKRVDVFIYEFFFVDCVLTYYRQWQGFLNKEGDRI
jgi:hypothetical protein